MRFEHDGKAYQWNGQVWLDSNFLQVPDCEARHLNERFLEQLLALQGSRATAAGLLRQEGVAWESRATMELAEKMARLQLARDPNDGKALAVVCASLRAQGQSLRAVRETDGRIPASPMLWTSRAAALCDVGRWEEAAELIQKVLRQGWSSPAYSVLRRIEGRRIA